MQNDPVEENLMKSIDQVAKEVEDTDRKFRETESEFISFQQVFTHVLRFYYEFGQFFDLKLTARA